MKIRIEPEGDEDFEAVEYSSVFELAVCGAAMRGGVAYHPFTHTWGDTIVLYGRLHECLERLRVHHG